MLVYVSNDGDVMFKTLAWFEKLISPTFYSSMLGTTLRCREQFPDQTN